MAGHPGKMDGQSKDRKYIQNRKHWCWAAACRIVGEQYRRHHAGFEFEIINETPTKPGQVTEREYEKGVATGDLEGINWNLQDGFPVRVDAWQRAIVMNANTAMGAGYEGDIAGDDEAKARGIKYFLTGNPDTDRLEVETLGWIGSEIPLPVKYEDRMMESFRRKEYIIGNAVFLGKNEFHSFVILCMEQDWVMLYDPADGRIMYHKAAKVYREGFGCSMGTGVIKWIQRIV
jgi:hypothetical protein